MKTMTEISKLIALVLRHKPEAMNIHLDAHGWTETSTLIERINAIQPFDMAMLEEIVRTDNKQRYAFNKDKTKIRANQGHSIPVDLELTPKQPPSILWHGTGQKSAKGIWKKGLLPNGRQYVHLSSDPETAAKVGIRHGEPVIFVIDAEAMTKDGLVFYQSQNGVWLADSVPSKYLQCKVAWRNPEWFQALREKARNMMSTMYITPNATDGWRWVRTLNSYWLQFEEDTNGLSLIGKSVFFLGKQDEYYVFSDGKSFYKTYVPQDWDSNYDRIRWERFDSFEAMIMAYGYCPNQEVPLELLPKTLLSVIQKRIPTFAGTIYHYTRKTDSNIAISLEALYDMGKGYPHNVKELCISKYEDSILVMQQTLIQGAEKGVLDWLADAGNQDRIVKIATEMLSEKPSK